MTAAELAEALARLVGRGRGRGAGHAGDDRGVRWAETVSRSTIYNIVAVAIIVLAILGYALGWFGDDAPPPSLHPRQRRQP